MIAGLHAAIMKFHNRIVDIGCGDDGPPAQR